MVFSGKRLYLIAIFISVVFSTLLFTAPTDARPFLSATNTIAKLNKEDEAMFSQNDILFYEPCESKSENATCTKEPVYDKEPEDISPMDEIDGSKITFLGDSLIALGTESVFNEYFGGADYGPSWNVPYSSYVRSGKQAIDTPGHADGPGGIVLLREIVRKGELRPILVFHLGGNGTGMDRIMDEILDLAGSDTLIVFVTNYWPQCYYDMYGENLRTIYTNQNEFLKKTAREHDNVIVGDWASFAQDGWYRSDCMHHRDIDMSRKYYRFISETILNGGTKNCSSGGLLEGKTIAEKVWNWLTERLNNENLSGVHIPAIVSGVMGNFWIESGINPFMVGSSAPYYGLHMWYGAYGGNDYVNKVNTAIGTNYFKFYGWWHDESDADKWLEAAGASEQDIDTAINANLEGIANGWGEFIDGIKNWGVADTARGYSDLFLVTMERAVNGESPIEDKAVANHYPGLYQGSAHRREKADYIYDKYASQANASGSTSGAKEQNNTTDGTKYSSSITWDTEGWMTSGMDGYIKDPGPNLGTRYNSGKPNKILLHYTQGGSGGGMGIYSNPGYAPHFTIDLPKRTVWQHHPLSEPSGAVIDSDDVRDIVQIEISGFGFHDDNPDVPDENSKCIINGVDYTSRDYCFAHFTDEDWDYLAQLLVGINKWGKENGADIPLTSEATWTGNVASLRMSANEFDATVGVVAHMHAPDYGNHTDTGNIWPLVEAAIARVGCSTNGDVDEISGAKNADKNAEDIGPFWFSDNDTESMKADLENYGDLAYRTGKAYGIPWVAIVVQGRYEDSGKNGFERMCGKNNFWGIMCYNGRGPGEGANLENLGEAFTLYGKTVHNGRYEEALKQTDPYEFIEKLGKGGWRVSNDGYVGYDADYLADLKKSIDALQAYIDSPEGQAVVAEFGAAQCGDTGQGFDECGNLTDDTNAVGNLTAFIKKVLELAQSKSGLGTPTNAYLEAVKKPYYHGGCGGQDCGGFVTTLMKESGWDPDYNSKNGNTVSQIEYLEDSDKWKDVTSSIKSNDDAKPGDVIICHHGIRGHYCPGRGHTLVFVGEIDGFEGKMASASLCDRWPEAEAGDISRYTSAGFHVYRKVK